MTDNPALENAIRMQANNIAEQWERDLRRLASEGSNLVRVGHKNELGVGIGHASDLADILRNLMDRK